MKQLFVFTLDGRKYGLDAGCVSRVLEDMDIAPAAMMPPYFLGLIYYRGEVYEVVDPAILMAPGKSAGSKKPFRLALVRWKEKKMALALEAIDGLVWMDADDNREEMFDADGAPVRRLSLERIWRRALEGCDGQKKV